MDENKSSTPESTPEENNINPAQPEANTAGPGEGKNKRSLRNTILTCISIALVLFAALIVLSHYVSVSYTHLRAHATPEQIE